MSLWDWSSWMWGSLCLEAGARGGEYTVVLVPVTVHRQCSVTCLQIILPVGNASHEYANISLSELGQALPCLVVCGGLSWGGFLTQVVLWSTVVGQTAWLGSSGVRLTPRHRGGICSAFVSGPNEMSWLHVIVSVCLPMCKDFQGLLIFHIGPLADFPRWTRSKPQVSPPGLTMGRRISCDDPNAAHCQMAHATKHPLRALVWKYCDSFLTQFSQLVGCEDQIRASLTTRQNARSLLCNAFSLKQKNPNYTIQMHLHPAWTSIHHIHPRSVTSRK